MTAIESLLNYNKALSAMAGDEELVPGLGPVSLLGGKFQEPGKSNDLSEVSQPSLPDSSALLPGFVRDIHDTRA